MSIIDRFKNGEIYVVCESRNQAEIFTNIVFSHGLKWRTGGTGGSAWNNNFNYISYAYRFVDANDRMGFIVGDDCEYFDYIYDEYTRFMFYDFMDEYVEEFGNILRGR